MRMKNEPQTKNRRISFNTGAYLNSNDLEKDTTTNKPENLSPVLWFYSLSKKKKICVGVSCLFFLLLLTNRRIYTSNVISSLRISYVIVF